MENDDKLFCAFFPPLSALLLFLMAMKLKAKEVAARGGIQVEIVMFDKLREKLCSRNRQQQKFVLTLCIINNYQLIITILSLFRSSHSSPLLIQLLVALRSLPLSWQFFSCPQYDDDIKLQHDENMKMISKPEHAELLFSLCEEPSEYHHNSLKKHTVSSLLCVLYHRFKLFN